MRIVLNFLLLFCTVLTKPLYTKYMFPLYSARSTGMRDMDDGIYNAVIENPEIYREGSLLFLSADLRIGKSLYIGLGSICISNINRPGYHGLELVHNLMEVADVEKWSELHGKPCRIVIEDGWIVRLIHFLDDAVVCDIKKMKNTMDVD